MTETSQALLDSIRASLATVIRGKKDVLELLLVGVLSSGHVLLEDVPGVGKTTLAKSLSRVFDMGFARVQFTPDLLPSDILGSQILRPSEGTFEFQPGPIFTNVFLADEINRASPRTQSALLEAMNEEQVTIEGTTRPLPKPFFVIATQNPVDFRGTYPLPEAQLDRFLLRLEIGYPPEDEELHILFERRVSDPLDAVRPLADAARLLELQQAVRTVEVTRDVGRYMVRLVRASRDRKELQLGISPRGALALFRAAQAAAFLDGRSYVTPDDVQRLAIPVLAHRVLLSQKATYAGGRTADVIRTLVEELEVPT
jgi:MoxR-like ATPase